MQDTANIIDAPDRYDARDVDVCMYNAADMAQRCRTAVMRNRPPAFRNPPAKGIYFLT